MSTAPVPSARLASIELTLLPKPARDDHSFWLARLEPLLAMKRGRKAELHRIATETQAGYGTVRRKFYALLQHGTLGLVDRRLAGPRWWRQAPETTALPAADQALVKLYCEKNDRSSRAGCKQLRADWRRGQVRTTQAKDPRTGYPRGWSIDNLLRYASDRFELTAARKGTAPAAAHRRLVYTTRADLYVGSHLQLDDMWHNVFVNSFAEKQAGRPLELFSHDLFSGRKVRFGVRVRTRKEDGTWHGLEERMTRYILAATLHLDGYSPRGTILVAEHGTAAIRDGIERALHEHSAGLITIERSGMQGAKAHAGQYHGVVRGNPRMKASLESSNNLTQNVFGHLPGQTGKDRQDRPEQLPALLADNERWLRLYDRLSPAHQALVQFPILEVNQFMAVAHELYGQIENDPDHDLEGWVQAGNVAQELLLGGQWIDQRVLMAGSADEQEMALALIGQGKLQTRPRRMTRREVWDRGAGELVKLTGAGVVAILGDDLARANPEIVRKGMIEFEDADIGPGVHRYEGVVFDPFGARRRLDEGEAYQVFANPFALDWLFVRDARGSYLGEAKRIVDPSRGNIEAVHRTMGATAGEQAERLAGVRERHAGEAETKRERTEINERLESGLPVTEAEHRTARREASAQRSAASFGTAQRGEESADPFPPSPKGAEPEVWTDEPASAVPDAPAPSTDTETW